MKITPRQAAELARLTDRYGPLEATALRNESLKIESEPVGERTLRAVLTPSGFTDSLPPRATSLAEAGL